MKVKIGTIDCEPTWAALFEEVKAGVLKVDELEKAIKLADTVRQAQKRGKTLIIHPDGKLEEEG